MWKQEALSQSIFPASNIEQGIMNVEAGRASAPAVQKSAR